MIVQTITHYKILAKLGEGGMGVVYKAEDTSLERTVALKLLANHLLDDSEAKTRFLREATAAAARVSRPLRQLSSMPRCFSSRYASRQTTVRFDVARKPSLRTAGLRSQTRP